MTGLTRGLRRRAVAATLGIALALAGAVHPALAATASPPTGRIESPVQDANAAPVTTATISISGEVAATNGGYIYGPVRVDVRSATDGSLIAGGDSPTESGKSTAPFSYTPTIPVNGRYHIVVTAADCDNVVDQNTNACNRGQAVEGFFNLDVPPAVPTGVRARVDASTRNVTISWKPNSEPDLLGYLVDRATGSQAYPQQPLGSTSTVSFVDDGAKITGGQYRYRVRAVRRSSDPNKADASSPSADTTVNVAPPESPPTSTPPGGSGFPTPTAAPGSASGSTSTGAGLALSGTVDLHAYGALLDQARKSASAQHQEPPDPGFDPSLPFKKGSDAEDGADAPKPVLGSSASENTRLDRKRSLGFLAAGLLATVLLMHAVWVRGELKRADELEVLAPDGVGAEPTVPQTDDLPTSV